MTFFHFARCWRYNSGVKNPKSAAVMSAAPSAGVAVASRPSDAARLPKSRPTDPLVKKLVAASWEEFEELDEEAAETELEPPSAEIKQVARRILTALTREFPRYYAVSPGEGREVAIQASAGAGKGRGVLIVCDDKDISCYVTMNGKSRRAHYDLQSAENLPDAFIRDAMRELG